MVHDGRMDDAVAAELAARMERDQTARTAAQRHTPAEAVDRLVEVDNETRPGCAAFWTGVPRGPKRCPRQARPTTGW
jgi:hypothetical protein